MGWFLLIKVVVLVKKVMEEGPELSVEIPGHHLEPPEAHEPRTP